MTHRTLDYEERLRHALRTAAESVEPEGDGLERIRARITTPRPAPAAWMAAGTEPAGSRIGPALRSFRDSRAMRWLFPAAGGGSPSPYRWLRPVAAMAAFVLIIGSGALALTTGSTSVLTAGGSNRLGTSKHLHKGGGGQPAGKGSQVGSSPSTGSSSSPAPTTTPSSSPSQGQSGHPNPSPSDTGTCTPPPPSATGGGPPSASPTPSSPSPSPTPSDSPSPTSSPNPSSGTTTTPSTPSATAPDASVTVDALTSSATQTPKPRKHHPHPTCS